MHCVRGGCFVGLLCLSVCLSVCMYVCVCVCVCVRFPSVIVWHVFFFFCLVLSCLPLPMFLLGLGLGNSLSSVCGYLASIVAFACCVLYVSYRSFLWL
ncbi:hypothetical protein P280DRAFT_80819 [Massarina eburnea CBS 473.64]|uniref:Uncharacterized protein n=1 Tax=Massarina eburnea CBS 473.64 TaxID=1395130 RepID=A0A6A6RV85_9PLEO|nr:hypothetical protein P280DRAFT_80819 [Massarina eburnea CBS 473.64]